MNQHRSKSKTSKTIPDALLVGVLLIVIGLVAVTIGAWHHVALPLVFGFVVVALGTFACVGYAMELRSVLHRLNSALNQITRHAHETERMTEKRSRV